jgi:hypothetical protein
LTLRAERSLFCTFVNARADSAVSSGGVLVEVGVVRRATMPNEENPLDEEMYLCESSRLHEAEGRVLEVLLRDGREERGRAKMSRTIRNGDRG